MTTYSGGAALGGIAVASARPNWGNNMASPTLAPISIANIGFGGSRILSGDTETQTSSSGFVMRPFSRVMVHDLASGALIAETVSDAAGNFSVPHLARREYLVTGIDPTGAFDPASTIRISA